VNLLRPLAVTSARLHALILVVLVRGLADLDLLFDLALLLLLLEFLQELVLHLESLLQELRNPSLLCVHVPILSALFTTRRLQHRTRHLQHEGYEVHVVLWAAAVRVSREGVLVGQPLQDHLQVVQQDLHEVRVARTDVLGLAREVTLAHLHVVVRFQAATTDWEEVVALRVFISNDGTFPLFLGVFELMISPGRVLMACEVNKVGVSNRGVPLSVDEPGPRIAHLLYLELLRVDIHAHNFTGLLGVSILAHDALGP
jgi:hypothetical protein